MKIGRYEILDIIGQGAMGTVYKALDPLIERTVAIKTIPIAKLKEGSTEFEARFLREAQSAGRLSHPNIVTIYDVGETDDLAYIAMEYLRGSTLRDVMDKGPMPLDLIITTALQLAEALAYAHEHGVVHRDIKPSNIVITLPHGQVKLTDFGIAHLINSERTHAGLMLGSPRYMSPEQAMGQEVTGCSDIFSLGAVLYEMVTGAYAFEGDSLSSILYRVINVMPPSPAKLRPEITAPFERIILRMLNKQAEARIDLSALTLELHKSEENDLPPNRDFTGAHQVPRIFSIIAFSTPLAVLVVTGIGMIVINYFLSLSSQEIQSRATHLPLLSTSNDTILDWTTQPQVDLVATLQNKNKPQQRTLAPLLIDKKQSQPGKATGGSPSDAYLQGLEEKKVEFQLKKTELLLKYTEHHPDVMLVMRQLEQLEAERRVYLRKHR